MAMRTAPSLARAHAQFLREPMFGAWRIADSVDSTKACEAALNTCSRVPPSSFASTGATAACTSIVWSMPWARQSLAAQSAPWISYTRTAASSRSAIVRGAFPVDTARRERWSPSISTPASPSDGCIVSMPLQASL